MLTIDGDNVYKGDVMFEKGIYLFIFYCLCFVEEIPENTVEEQVMEETYQDLEGEDIFRISNDR